MAETGGEGGGLQGLANYSSEESEDGEVGITATPFFFGTLGSGGEPTKSGENHGHFRGKSSTIPRI